MTATRERPPAQLNLLELGNDPDPDFDGVTYDPSLDKDRLTRQLGRVWDAMQDGGWRTLKQLASVTGDPEASVSARLRDLRKDKFGGWNVERERVSAGLWRYQVTGRK